MELRSDWKEWLELLNSKSVEYVIVGAYAVAHHGHPRLTGDFDVLVRPEPQNIDKLLSCLEDFGFGSLNLTAEDFLPEGSGVMLGHAPGRVDILTGISGVSADEVFVHSIEGRISGVSVRFISYQLLLKNKRATGRLKDAQDVDILERGKRG